MRKATCYFDPRTNKFQIVENVEEEIETIVKSSQLFYALKKYLCRFDENTVFRGQTKDWKPIASIFRSDYKNLSENEQDYYSNIKREHEIEIGECKNNYMLWSKMQHFGYPTRLLDVTTNPFKAMAFMIDGINKEKMENTPPCIYVFEPKGSNEKLYMSEVIDSSMSEIGNFPLIVPSNNQQTNIRLHAQSGQFIYFNCDCASEEEYLVGLKNEFNITKIEVKLNTTENIDLLETKLNEFGYGLETLYPDMIKRSEYYKNKWKK